MNYIEVYFKTCLINYSAIRNFAKNKLITKWYLPMVLVYLLARRAARSVSGSDRVTLTRVPTAPGVRTNVVFVAWRGLCRLSLALY